MNSGKSVLLLLVLTLLIIPQVKSETEEEKEIAVPALSDLPLLPAQSAASQILRPGVPQEQLNPLPPVTEMRWLDINGDLNLNDFDVKQFQAIVESLHGEKLTGLELSILFNGEQKNQRESFPTLYDLDRDGMFTPYDVDYFTGVIHQLDEGSTRGNALIQKYRLEIFPLLNQEARGKR